MVVINNIESKNKKKDKKVVNIVLPVYNEEKILESSVKKLFLYVQNDKQLSKYNINIIIADNKSNDKTKEIALNLEKLKLCKYLKIDQKGKGIAVKTSWLKSLNDNEYLADACVVMDIDLSTDLKHTYELINPLFNGFDISIGSRLQEKSKTKRSFKRSLISKTYNLIVKMLFFTRFSDAQCGFKGVTKKVIQDIVPKIKDNEWFYDTELLVLAEKKGYKIYDFPVKWIEDVESNVNMKRDIPKFLINLIKLRYRLWFNKDQL